MHHAFILYIVLHHVFFRSFWYWRCMLKSHKANDGSEKIANIQYEYFTLDPLFFVFVHGMLLTWVRKGHSGVVQHSQQRMEKKRVVAEFRWQTISSLPFSLFTCPIIRVVYSWQSMGLGHGRDKSNFTSEALEHKAIYIA